jgi:hypothetical protein
MDSAKTAVVRLSVIALLIPMLVLIARLGYHWSLARQVADCEAITRSLEQVDGLQRVPSGGILMLGRNHLARWRNVPDVLLGSDVVVRASPLYRPEAIAACFQRAVAWYQPDITVLLLEMSDASRASDDVFLALDKLLRAREHYGVSPHLVVIPPLDGPAFEAQLEQLQDFTVTLARWARAHPGVHVMPIGTRLYDATGAVDPSLYWPDGETLFATGYERLEQGLREELRTTFGSQQL